MESPGASVAIRTACLRVQPMVYREVQLTGSSYRTFSPDRSEPLVIIWVASRRLPSAPFRSASPFAR
jgi:hypothetical protein